jgi:ribonuclease HII
MDFRLDKNLLRRFGCIAGVDEVGIGPLAGPVLAACLILRPGVRVPASIVSLVDDSKKLSAKKREIAYDIMVGNFVDWGVGLASVEEIATLNIYQAARLAMRRAITAASNDDDIGLLLVDGNKQLVDYNRPQLAVVKGDSKHFCIAAASIIAKVSRDRLMLELDELYPQYGFARHMGYPTKEHLSVLEKQGASACHRPGFAPVDRALACRKVVR